MTKVGHKSHKRIEIENKMTARPYRSFTPCRDICNWFIESDYVNYAKLDGELMFLREMAV